MSHRFAQTSFLCVHLCSKCEFMDTIRGRAWPCERTTHPAFFSAHFCDFLDPFLRRTNSHRLLFYVCSNVQKERIAAWGPSYALFVLLNGFYDNKMLFNVTLLRFSLHTLLVQCERFLCAVLCNCAVRADGSAYCWEASRISKLMPARLLSIKSK